MTGGRPHLGIGEHGNIPVPINVGPSRYRARCRYRGSDGKTVMVTAFGQTKGAARAALLDKIDRRRAGDTALAASSRITLLLDQWLDEVDSDPRKAPQTRDLYRYLVDKYIRPRIGQLTIAEATAGRCDTFLQRLADGSPSVARSVRAVLRGVMNLAVRRGALTVNPIRETRPISTDTKAARALTPDEVEQITDALRADETAVRLDLPDLVDFALDTGCRIGELLAIRETDCDLEAGTVEIRGTVVRRRGRNGGVTVQDRTKSKAGARVLALPPQAVELLRRRRDEIRFQAPEGVVFPSPSGPFLRDPTNAAGDLRDTLTRLELPQATFHTFRKTVATRLDQAGQSSRAIADQLGHSHPSMTLDTYMGRKVANPDAATALTR